MADEIKVTVCVTESSFTHVTVPPFLICIADGLNAKFFICTMRDVVVVVGTPVLADETAGVFEVVVVCEADDETALGLLFVK